MVAKMDSAGTRRRTLSRIALLAVVLGLVAAWVLFDLGRFFNLGYLREIHDASVAAVQAQPLAYSTLFFVIYVVVTALSLPGAAIMTLAGGAIFGLWWGLVLVSFASSVGATLAMLIARGIAGDWVRHRFTRQLEAVDRGIERDGGFYLFSIRMVPLFPFFVVNLVMGLTAMSTWTYYWVSQVGMLPGTLIYVFAGTQLGNVESVGDVLSPGLIAALTLMGLFPLLARKLMGWVRRHRSGDMAEGEAGDG